MKNKCAVPVAPAKFLPCPLFKNGGESNFVDETFKKCFFFRLDTFKKRVGAKRCQVSKNKIFLVSNS
jgi:hypothetical protein